VVIATPHALHYPIALDCIRAGVHVLSEKPLAESAVEVSRLIAESRVSGAQLLVNNT
jgi:predicted dehydrogenase